MRDPAAIQQSPSIDRSVFNTISDTSFSARKAKTNARTLLKPNMRSSNLPLNKDTDLLTKDQTKVSMGVGTLPQNYDAMPI